MYFTTFIVIITFLSLEYCILILEYDILILKFTTEMLQK